MSDKDRVATALFLALVLCIVLCFVPLIVAARKIISSAEKQLENRKAQYEEVMRGGSLR